MMNSGTPCLPLEISFFFRQKSPSSRLGFLLSELKRALYGQRLAASSQPAARGGGLPPAAAATAGVGIRMGCCGGAAVRGGFGCSPNQAFSSSPSSGAGVRHASTSLFQPFSSRSFFLQNSFTTFHL